MGVTLTFFVAGTRTEWRSTLTHHASGEDQGVETRG